MHEDEVRPLEEMTREELIAVARFWRDTRTSAWR